MRQCVSLLICILVPALSAGCANPLAQLKADSVARAAIGHIRAGDAEGLAPLLSRPHSAPSVVAELQPAIHHGKVEYRGDDGLFPMPTYRRYYLVHPDPARDGTEARATSLIVDFLDGPVRIDSIFIEPPKSPEPDPGLRPGEPASPPQI